MNKIMLLINQTKYIKLLRRLKQDGYKLSNLFHYSERVRLVKILNDIYYQVIIYDNKMAIIVMPNKQGKMERTTFAYYEWLYDEYDSFIYNENNIQINVRRLSMKEMRKHHPTLPCISIPNTPDFVSIYRTSPNHCRCREERPSKPPDCPHIKGIERDCLGRPLKGNDVAKAWQREYARRLKFRGGRGFSNDSRGAPRR